MAWQLFTDDWLVFKVERRSREPYCAWPRSTRTWEDRLGSAKVEIGLCEVVDALMIADVIVVFDEGPYLPFEIAR